MIESRTVRCGFFASTAGSGRVNGKALQRQEPGRNPFVRHRTDVAPARTYL